LDRRAALEATPTGRPIPADSPHLPKPGDRLESFEIHAAIGAGGMGAVFLATDTRLDRQVALKVLPPEQSLDPETVRRFYLEGKAAARLDHENIARVYTLGYDRGLHFIAFEYVEGTTLRQRVEHRGVLSPAEAVDLSLQICEALIHAASRGVVHRDIKPSNIIVTPQGRAKLVDMGLARHFERGHSDHGLTQSGMTLGTFDYISPEQARDPRNVDIRSDLYSLGCTMYFLLTGRPPFPDGTVLQKLLQHQGDPAPDVRDLNPAVPEPLAAVILRLMEKDRERRFQTPEQLRDQLASVGRSLGLVVPAPLSAVATPSVSPVLGWERHLVWAIPAIGLALLLTGLSLWGPGSELPTRESGAEAPLLTPRPRVTPAGPEPRSEITATPTVQTSPIRVDPREDLGQVIAQAPSRATIVLAQPGPYRLRPRDPISRPTPDPNGPARHLTIRGEGVTRPIVLIDWAPSETSPLDPEALLDLGPGMVRLEGIEFDVGEPPPGRAPQAVIRAHQTELVVENCVFRGPRSSGPGSPGLTALTLRGQPGRPPATTRLLGCTFLGGLSALEITGPADLQLDSVRSAVRGTFLVLDNPPGRPESVDLQARGLRVLAGEEPIFRILGTEARFVVEGSAFGPPGSEPRASLLAIDEPDRLDWRGRDNLYGPFAVYLSAIGTAGSGLQIRDFRTWAAPNSGRELRSRLITRQLWQESDPWAVANRAADPESALRLADTALTAAEPDSPDRVNPLARFSESITSFMSSAFSRRPRESPSAPKSVAAGPQIALGLSDDPRPLEPGEAPDGPVPMPVAPMGQVAEQSSEPFETEAPRTSPDRDRPANTLIGENFPQLLPLPLGERGLAASPVSAASRPRNSDSSSSGSTIQPSPNDRPAGPADSSASVVRTRGGWLAALADLPAQGGVVRLASDARLNLGPTDIPRGGRWIVQAEPGVSRPLLRLDARSPSTRGMPDTSPLFRLAAGAALELRDIDIVVSQSEQPVGWSGSLISLAPGADLSLIRCTLTLIPASEGDPPAAPLIRLVPGQTSATPAPATLRVEDSFLRTGGSVIEDLESVRLNANVSGSVLLSSGAAFDAAVPTSVTAGDDRSRLEIRQCLIRAAGGLARLRGSRTNRTDRPVLELTLRDSILTTTPRGDPLLRIEGRGDSGTDRDWVVWDGRGVVYHLIEVYRLDETTNGAAPAPYRRLSWDVAVGPREDSAFHGDARFSIPMTSDQMPWRMGLAEVRLAPDTPVPNAGPRLDRIPAPPPPDVASENLSRPIEK
jgi:serine/threonine-protein kinase